MSWFYVLDDGYGNKHASGPYDGYDTAQTIVDALKLEGELVSDAFQESDGYASIFVKRRSIMTVGDGSTTEIDL